MIPKKILYCTDFSENSKPAQQLALEYARAFGASLVVLHVFTHGFSGESSIYNDFTEQTQADEWALYESALKKVEDSAYKSLQKIADESGQLGSEVKVCLRKGIAVKEIINCAREESANLIILGTHGWTGLNHLLLGSVAEKVLKMAPMPVLIVRSISAQNAAPL
jgi:universal stress protein A